MCLIFHFSFQIGVETEDCELYWRQFLSITECRVTYVTVPGMSDCENCHDLQMTLESSDRMKRNIVM